MNKKFKALLGYVRGLNCNIDFTIQFYNDGDSIDYIDFTCAKNPGFQMASNMEQIFYDIAELYAEDLYDGGLGSYGDGSDYFTVDGTIYPDKLVSVKKSCLRPENRIAPELKLTPLLKLVLPLK